MSRLGLTLGISLTFTGCSDRDADIPSEYRRLEVPEARLRSSQARERGRALFQQHCALCHGPRADGRGARREGLTSRPRDFTDPAWRRQISPRRVFYAVREGVRGTPMPSWKSLPEGEAWDLVAFLLSVGEAPVVAPPTPTDLPPAPASNARGAMLAPRRTPLRCTFRAASKRGSRCESAPGELPAAVPRGSPAFPARPPRERMTSCTSSRLR
jgi:mono/diheme cytochrome c family protein